MRLHISYVFIAALIIPLFHAEAQMIDFEDVAISQGINYSYITPSSFGGGLSFHDWNNDGKCDISFGSTTGDGIYIMDNMTDSFMQVTLSALITEVGYSRCVLWADIDNDGDKDLFLTNEVGINKLYANDGSQNLTEITSVAGLSNQVMYSYSACMGDYDADGFLDIYIVNRNILDPSQSHNKLYRNLGNGQFEDVTIIAGVTDSTGLGFAAAFFDYNNDGFIDLYVANDKEYSHNKLYRNLGDGRFTDVSAPLTTGIGIDAMGIAVGDYDDNGYLDLYITNTPNSSASFGGNVLLRNNGDGSFTDVADQLGVRVFKVSWGANFSDFDNDGDLDLFVASGQMGGFTGGQNNLFVNQGNGTFVDDTLSPIAQIQDLSFGSAVGDFDDDGCYDIAVMNGNGTHVNLWKNQGNTNNYIKMTFQGILSNRDGIGTRVHVHSGGSYVVRYTQCGSSYGSQSSNELIVGLGQNPGIDSIVIFWPSGVVNSVLSPVINMEHHFIEDTSCHRFTKTYTDSIGKHHARIRWSVDGVAQRYRIRGKAEGTDEWIYTVQNDGNATDKTISSLTSNTRYDWQVRAICNNSETNTSGWTGISSFYTLCEEPAFTSHTPLDSHTVKLAWQPVPGVSGYLIVGANSLGQIASFMIPDGTSSELVVYDLEYEVTYKWRMATICDPEATRLSPPTPSRKFKLSNSFKNNMIEANPEHSSIGIYPNPSVTGRFYLTCEDYGPSPDKKLDISIYNTSGQVVYAMQYGSCPSSIDLPLPAGSYLLQLVNGDTSAYRKIMILR